MCSFVFQEMAGLLTISHVDISLSAISFLQLLASLPMGVESDFSSGVAFDKRVCASFRKEAALMGGLVKLGILAAGQGLGTEEPKISISALGLLTLIMKAEKDKREFGMVEMTSWSDRR